MLLLVLLPQIVSAAPNDILPSGSNPGSYLPQQILNQSPTITGTILGLLQIFLSIVGIIAVAMIVYGGFRYVTAGGSDEVTKSAKKTITNSIIGLVVIILSYVIVRIVTNAVFGYV